MTEKEQKAAAKAFAAFWKDKGYEKGESQAFWLSLLRDVYGVEHPEQYISFEDQVKLDHTSFIDGYIEKTHVMIEQKGLGKNLRKGIRQSDGSLLSPFQQAKRYAAELPYSKRPRWIITCNFAEFLVYDMEKPNGEPEQIFLKDLPKEFYRLQFLVDTGNENLKKEMEISLKAGDLVGKLYDAILKQYRNPDDPETLKSLNKLCVRLVFCLYAEDAGIFGRHQMFHDYLKQFQPKQIREEIIKLFQVLDTKPEDRDPYMDDDLAAFPYVNGGLFADEHIEIPRFTDEIVSLLLHNASEDFDWSGISPTIFGAVFESTLNPETRRSGGMHYTSLENIHKVIDPLFLDKLKAELNEIKSLKIEKTRREKLQNFRKKLSTLVFLDPAAGSGNFLTETYICLRRLENDALFAETHGQMMLGMDDLIQVNIGQFYGIEINDFAVTVAKTALWIAESQMMQETEQLMQVNLDFLPLKSYANIVEGNALRLDWESVVPKEKLSYIMGNPPFVGHKNVIPDQKNDMKRIFEGKQGRLDYVSAWYLLASQYIQNTTIECAFVSTNTVVQGVHIETLWKKLCDQLGIIINFAFKTFKWTSESKKKASVFCVIISFSMYNRKTKYLYSVSNDNTYSSKRVEKISPYLDEESSAIITSRTTPLADVPHMVYGNIPRDGGFYTFSDEEKVEFLKKEPNACNYMYRFLGSKEYINNTQRWILFLKDATPSELRKMPAVMERIEKVKNFRLSSKAKEIHKFAETPTLFAQQTQPIGVDFIIVPIVSSSRRRYIPIGYVNGNTIVNNRVFLVPKAGLYVFGVLTSNVHNAWMRKVAVRLKDDYSYSKDLVYNTFPWCNPTPEQKQKIESTAQAILDARAKYPDCSLADLYDETTMPPELRKAHQQNDFAVMAAYGFPRNITESECVAELMKMYQRLTEEKMK